MDISWDIVVTGLVCTCMGLWAGWGIYHGKVKALELEIKALKRELSDERERGEAYGKAADAWRGAAMRADAEVGSLKQEKDAEIAGLKQKLDDAQARLYAESVDTWIRERRLQRALWVTRAERAASWQIHFSLSHNHSIGREFTINGASMACEGMVTMRTARDWAMIWKNVMRKCLKKAEEYK